MTDKELQPDETGARPTASPVHKARKALQHVKRELTDEELASPGVKKLLVDELEKLEDENIALRELRDKFHEVDKSSGILAEKLNSKIGQEILSGACLAIGATAMGYAPAVWDAQPSGWLSLTFGAVLTILGIVAKCMRL